MEPRRRRFALFVALTVAVLFYFHPALISLPLPIHSQSNSPSEHIVTAPANATLGFGAILAVSHSTSPRRTPLLAGANTTNLTITIPVQPSWTSKNLTAFRAGSSSRISHGSALAWLGHLNALRWFLNSGLETALILEDDVDWDVQLRRRQIPAVAAAARTLLTSSSVSVSEPASQSPASEAQERHETLLTPAQAGGYWGNTTAWDILYLGHCGDVFPPSVWTDTPTPQRILISDPTLLDPSALHPYTASFLAALGIPPRTRVFHRSVFPLCTFAIAVTRDAARRLLEVAGEEPEGGCVAYDVRVLEACRDLGMRCWSLSPELFHHVEGGSLIEGIDAEGDREGEDGKGRAEVLVEERIGVGVHDEGMEKVDKDGRGRQGRLFDTAPNIRCGARGVGMSTEAARTLKYSFEEVERQRSCLRDDFVGETQD